LTQSSNNNGTILTKETLIGLGASSIAQIVMDEVANEPKAFDRIAKAVEEVLNAKSAVAAAATPSSEEEPYMVGSSPELRKVYDVIRKIANTEAPILITGESGTGKELAARAIHERSPYAGGPFVAINCAALPPTLMASELFGHEKGAFTGADQARIGRIQAAEGGTVLLDEIGDLPMDMQSHLLRFLQERTIDRVGGTQPIKVNVRVVAATNVDLKKAVAEGRFREDLLYRLDVLALELPPLRARGEDVDLLTTFFMRKFSQEMGRSLNGLTDDAIEAVRDYSWPGNVRELISCVRRAVVMADGDWITADNLGVPWRQGKTTQAPAADSLLNAEPVADHSDTVPGVAFTDRNNLPSLDKARREMEENLLQSALTFHDRNIKKTAEHLGVSRVTLYRLMEKYCITSDAGVRH
jgi:DNA-binding NtrC family response regulator